MSAERGRVLIVDDDSKIQRLLAISLERSGFETVAASGGQEALDILQRPGIDVVLLDLVLDRESGHDVLRQVRDLHPVLPVIILTGHGTIDKAVEAIKVGAYDFLEKPASSDRIALTIENALKNKRLEGDKTRLLEESLDRYRMVGTSAAIASIYSLIEKAAASDSRVFITGESGSGKELVARAIHYRSARAAGPFLAVNCAAIPEDLIESELFGHEKGSYTGALFRREGKFVLASSGTIFLDEIGDMSPRVQAKVLRAVEEAEIQRIGGEVNIAIDARIIAASNQNLEQAVREGRFREDLYFRINVVDIPIPPLRERREDIPLLVEHFTRILSEERKRPIPHFKPSAMEFLLNYDWPGNCRELRNLVEKILVLYPDQIITETEVAASLRNAFKMNSGTKSTSSLSDKRKKAEKDALKAKLLALGWNYRQAAAELGISRATLFNKIKAYGLRRKSG